MNDRNAPGQSGSGAVCAEPCEGLNGPSAGGSGSPCATEAVDVVAAPLRPATTSGHAVPGSDPSVPRCLAALMLRCLDAFFVAVSASEIDCALPHRIPRSGSCRGHAGTGVALRPASSDSSSRIRTDVPGRSPRRDTGPRLRGGQLARAAAWCAVAARRVEASGPPCSTVRGPEPGQARREADGPLPMAAALRCCAPVCRS